MATHGEIIPRERVFVFSPEGDIIAFGPFEGQFFSVALFTGDMQRNWRSRESWSVDFSLI